MKKLFAGLLILGALLLGLGACGEGKAPGGLLAGEEIALYESQYFADNDAMLKALGLTGEDVSLREFGLWALKGTRTVGGLDFEVTLMVSETEPEGLMGVWLTGVFDLDDQGKVKTAAKAIYEQALELYGEPDTYPGYEAERYLSWQLQQDQPGNGLETWAVGEKTDFTLSLNRYDEEDYQAFTILCQYQVRMERE